MIYSRHAHDFPQDLHAIGSKTMKLSGAWESVYTKGIVMRNTHLLSRLFATDAETFKEKLLAKSSARFGWFFFLLSNRNGVMLQ